MKYPNGYQSKIDYYTYKVNKCIEELDYMGLAHYSDKVSYFMRRQAGLIRRGKLQNC
jgi:hypothetical protein